MRLDELQIGETGIIQSLQLQKLIKHRLQSLGFIKGANITLINIIKEQKGPFIYYIKNSSYTLNKEVAHNIIITLKND